MRRAWEIVLVFAAMGLLGLSVRVCTRSRCSRPQRVDYTEGGVRTYIPSLSVCSR